MRKIQDGIAKIRQRPFYLEIIQILARQSENIVTGSNKTQRQEITGSLILSKFFTFLCVKLPKSVFAIR